MNPTTSRALAARLERHENAAAKAVRKQEPKMTADRYTVTLRADFVAKPNSDAFSLDPAFTFTTTDGEPVYAFNRTPLLKARWCEPGTLDARQSWRKVGAYTFGREVEAMVERTSKGYLRIVWLDRGDVKAKVTE